MITTRIINPILRIMDYPMGMILKLLVGIFKPVGRVMASRRTRLSAAELPFRQDVDEF